MPLTPSTVLKRRIPIALRLFITVLLVTCIISTLSLGVINWSIQKNFSRYVTQLEMQKLEHLNNNLGEIYQVYGNWQNAINITLKDLPERFLRDVTKEELDKSSDEVSTADRPMHNAVDIQGRLTQLWLNRQYDIALQQNEIIKNPKLFQAYIRAEPEQQRLLAPSHFEPFLMPLDAHTDRSPSIRRWLAPVPDHLGLGRRLALYNAQHRLIAGESSPDMQFQPIIADGQKVGYLGLRPALDEADILSVNFFSNQQRYLLFIYAISLLLSLIAATVLAATFRKPIYHLLKAAQELSQGNYQYHVKVKSNDELGDLAKVINQLAYILDQHEQSRRQWVADTSHELKTPLSVLQAQIEALQDGVRQATPEHLARMQHQVMSLKKLTQDLADLAQADAAQLTCYMSIVNPWAMVVHEIENFRPQLQAKQLTIEYKGEPSQLETDPDRLRQIVVNLLSNSLRYTLEGGHIKVEAVITEHQWQLIIDDTPLGVTEDQLRCLGERFYRVDDSRTRSTGGTGLGLALSKKIAQILGGSLQFDHSPLGGLRCTVTLNR